MDVNTLIPFLEDAGYESLENYRYLNENGYKSYIKPSNYEIRKKEITKLKQAMLII